jgi:hypothetical protein
METNVIHTSAIIIRAPKTTRVGWKEAFIAMHTKGDDTLLDEEAPTKWDAEAWAWP